MLKRTVDNDLDSDLYSQLSVLAENSVCIQYWCSDGKYIIYVARLRNGGKTSF